MKKLRKITMHTDTFDQIDRADPLVETVLAQIMDAIVAGRLQSGDKLVEARLGEQLGVSRGPIREAFRRLEQLGLVEKIPYRGTFVSELTERDVEDLHRVRERLEGLAAQLVAESHDTEAIATLEALLNEMREAAATGDHGRMMALDADFHDALFKFSSNGLLREIWVTVGARLRRFLLLKRRHLYPSLDKMVRMHEPIVRAISEGDPDRAEAEARHHVLEAWQLMIAAGKSTTPNDSRETET